MAASPHSRVNLASAGLALAALLHSAWLIFGWGRPEQREWYSDLHYLVVVALFVGVTALVWCGSAGPLRRAFGLLLGMAVIRLAAEGTWTYLELILRVPPFPSVADALYFLGYLAQGAALLMLAQVPLRRLSTLRLGLDSLTVVGAAGVFSWQLFLAGIADDPSEPLVSRLVTLMYPALDLALLSLLLLVVFRNQRLRVYEALFAAGLLLNIVADYFFAYLTHLGTYVTGHPIDAVWAWSFVLEGLGVALAGRLVPAENRGAPGWQVRFTLFAPYVALLASFVLLIRLQGGQPLESKGVVWGTALVTFLVVARQIVMLVDNARLNLVLSAREAQLEHLAHHDALTGLPNRRALTQELEDRVDRARRRGTRLALLFTDLDGFKHINDTLGHAAGDAALREIAGRLQTHAPPDAYVVRLSGDEFALLLPDVPDADFARSVGSKLVQAMTVPLVLEGVSLTVGASVGVSLWPDHAQTPGELLSTADAAMYAVKTHGKNGVEVFRPELTAGAHVHQNIRRELAGALERGELHLHYQAVGDLRGGVVGAGALLRWSNPGLGEVAPGDFSPVAEETGLIIPIGAWVLREACTQAAVWHADGLTLGITVSVSPVQLAHPAFAGQVQQALRESGLLPHALELELTQPPTWQDLARGGQPLTLLTDLGVRISLGNVSIGTLALPDLLRLPVTALRVDPEVVGTLNNGEEEPGGAARLLRAMTGLAHALDLTVIAQGVEHEWQRRRIQDLGCDLWQGRLLAPPLTAADFEGWWHSQEVSL